MQNNKLIQRVCQILILIAVFLFFSCETITKPYPRQVNYPDHPRSILIMPVVNRAVDLGGPSTFMASSVNPLAETGYYVLPVTLTTEMFKQNGVTVAEEALTIPHSRLREIFGADAALYITVINYGVSYQIVSSTVHARANASLVDLRTGHLLWSDDVTYFEPSSNTADVSSWQSVLRAVVDSALDQVTNVLSNRAYDVGRTATRQLFSVSMLNEHTGTRGQRRIKYGPYHPLFGPEEEELY